ncbi:TonB-dependent receptor [Flammeovirga yaeyamensis]|uniref:TonB-dependent receptor n=1 Tax=Flammeovirga yaeyamensis TaxID=367791 RepID=A0AAX1N863_9BACT|nr:TonB-dependent receptor [Flammeovirga yaeyamensis]MBB3698935.1 iron complex outermembrane receptor protein [Flammeovirga yaeyamensis]NMF36369.1 TonB-dependent receptor [Flammeovirga yaeyamensis]QWG03670.1 TonB-dependent receptor [Flammeovirga yaeyamensis]
MKVFNYLLFISAIFFISLNAHGQNIKGTIIDGDSGTPIVGATIVEVGTQNGTTTNFEGKFSLVLSKKETQVKIEFIGFEDITKDVKEGDVLDIKLTPDELTLESVVVSANRVEEDLQTVSVAATVITGKDLEDMSVKSTVEALNTVPNLITDSYGPSQTNISIRGISTNFDGVGLEQAVGMYINDVYQSRAYGFNAVMMDIERVEVLRGPQGTLFGKNTVGGVANIITAQPNMDNGASIELSAGNYNYMQARGMANVMLVPDKLAFRVTGAYNYRQGSYVEHLSEEGQEANKTKFGGARGALLYKPSSKVDITLEGYYYNDASAEASMTYLSSPDLVAVDPDLFAADDWENRKASFSEPFTFSRDQYGASAKVIAQMGTGTFSSISAYSASSDRSIQDVEVSPIPAVYLDRGQKFNTFTQELRYNSDKSKRFSYIGGLYGVKETIEGNDIGVTQEFLPPLLGPDFGIDDLFIPGYTEEVNNLSTIDNTSLAAFVSGTFKFTPQFKATAGVRFTHESKVFNTQQTTVESQDAIDMLGFPLVYMLGTPYDNQEFKSEDNVITGDFGLSYEINPNHMVYGKFARGFKGTGYNFAVSSYLNLESFMIDPVEEANVLYKPEYINSYEIGYKSSFNNRLRLNVAAYYIDYENKQELLFAGLTNFIANADKSTGYGGEIEVDAMLFKGFRVNLNGGIQKMTYDEFKVGDVDLSGNKMAKAPEFTMSVTPEYTKIFNNGSKLFAMLNVSYNGQSFNDIYNTESISRKAAAIVNARLGYSIKNSRYNIGIWGKNLTNELYFGHGFQGLIGDFVSINQARTYGADLKINIF